MKYSDPQQSGIGVRAGRICLKFAADLQTRAQEATLTHLRKMMLEEPERRDYSAGTILYYVRFVERFAQHFGKSPDKPRLEHVRSYQSCAN